MISWIITFLCIVGSLLNAWKNRWCFLFWSIGNIAWLVIDLMSHNYSRAVLDIFQQIVTTYGAFCWRKDDLNDESKTKDEPAGAG